LQEGRGLAHITVSSGVAIFDRDGIGSCEELMRIADNRLYEAKGQGKNRVVSA
jgi:GGDEF domain-containing protein